MRTPGARRPPAPAVAAIAAILLGLSVWGFLNSAYFRVSEVRVVGAKRLTPDTVRRLAAIPGDANVIRLAVDAVERALEDHVWILDADVRRDLPSTVVIRILERRAVGWVGDPDGAALVAGDGTVLQRRSSPPDALPELGLSSAELKVGDRLDELGGILRVVAAMSARLLEDIQGVELYGGDVSIALRDGATVLYGPPVDLDAKNHALAEVIRWAEREEVSMAAIDVRVPSAPSLRPVGARPTPYPSTSPPGG